MSRLRFACAAVALVACGDNTRVGGMTPGPDAGPPAITVQVADGTLLGKDLGDGTHAFLGVPYAAPPVGANRWRLPQPVVPWTGVLDARMKGSQCPQSLGFSGPSSVEDCLYLNVWVPPNASAHTPVFLWIHGGAFVFGSGGDAYYDGHVLAKTQNVIVVTINYRLGALGFMALAALDHEDAAYPSSGNYGIEDQFAAIQWVHTNIAAFGGDPTHVLLAGESAGGYSTCIHYASARTAGMFQTVISESGVCSAFANPHTDAVAVGAALATQLGCAQSTDADLLACLRAVDSQTILNMTTTPIESQTPGGPLFDPTSPLFWPNDDGVAYTGTLQQALAAPPSPRPLLLGTNHDEGTLFVSSIFAKPVTDEPELEAALAVRFSENNVAAIVARYPIASYASANDALAAATTDALFVCPARRTARAVVAAGAPVFRYEFQKALENPLLPSAGVTHSAEIPFVFGNDDYLLGMVGSSGAPLAAAMQDYWQRFGETSDPNGGPEPAWPPYAGSSDPYVVLDVPIGTGSALESDACDFWDGLSISL